METEIVKESIPYISKSLDYRNTDFGATDVRCGMFILDEYSKFVKRSENNDAYFDEMALYMDDNFKILRLKCYKKDLIEYAQHSTQGSKVIDRTTKAMEFVRNNSWIRCYEEIDDEGVFESTETLIDKILIPDDRSLDYVYFNLKLDVIEKVLCIMDIPDKPITYIHPWIYNSRYKLSKHQIRLYELFFRWRRKNTRIGKTYPLKYETIKNFFGVNYINMSTFKQKVLDKSIEDLRDRNILDVRVEKIQTSDKRKSNYVFKMKILKGGVE